MQYAKSRSILATILFACVALFLASCGGGGSGGSSTANVTGQSGSVALLMTDAPAEYFDKIMVTVEKAELLSDGGRVTILDETRTFNLLKLTDARVFAIRNDVPAGTYSKIRLTLSKLELIKLDEFGHEMTPIPVKLPGNGKLDLVPRGDFTVVPGGSLVIQIDMDANKSIHIVKSGSKDKYQFRPVIFVDIISDVVDGNIVRVHGTIRDIDPVDRDFELCNSSIDINYRDDDHVDRDGCIDVAVVDRTSIFDEDGQPASFDDLIEGNEATVYGKFRRDDDYDYHDDDYDDDHELDDLELVAGVIELGPEGTFLTLNGTAQSSVDVDDRFTLAVEAGQGFVAGTELTVQVQDGTKVIDRQGNLLSVADISLGDVVAVDGVLDISADPDLLYAALIVLDMDAASRTSLSGTVATNPDGSCGLTVSTATGDRSVRTTDADVYLVSSTGTSGSEPISVSDLMSGQQVDVYGVEATDGCFDADLILAFVEAVPL